MFVDAGALNKRIKIIRREGTEKAEDPDGYPLTEEVVVYSCWAKFSQTSGTEAMKANADFSDLKVRFLIRWPRAAIDRKMFVRYNGADYEIEYVNSYGDGRQYLELWARWIGLKRRPS